jgi:hypothetical protein
MSTAAHRPGTVWALLALTAIQVIGATAGGIGLVQDPIDNIGMPLSMLEGSPFSNYLYPGLVLLLVVGLFPIVPLVGLALGRTWGWWLELAAGCGLIIWIIAEVAMLGYLPGMGIALQIIMGLLGVVIVVLALLRPTRRYFAVRGT